MIIRQPVKCITCGQSHTLRIGMGQEEVQRHTFTYKSCGEQITVRLDVDYTKISTAVTCEVNAILSAEIAGSPIVNLDANFLIPEKDQGKDGVFFRLEKLHNNVKAAIDGGYLADYEKLTPEQLAKRPFRRPDFLNEWQSLRKAWALSRRGKTELASTIVDQVGADLYPEGTVSNLADWCWNFTGAFAGRESNTKLNAVLSSMGSPTPKN